MDRIKLVCNRTRTGVEVNNDERYYECIDLIFLDYFDSKYFNIKLCQTSLIFKYNNFSYYQIEYEVVESIPEMTPKQLYNYWRLMYE